VVVRQEERLYEEAREVMREQWEEELGDCAVVVRKRVRKGGRVEEK